MKSLRFIFPTLLLTAALSLACVNDFYYNSHGVKVVELEAGRILPPFQAAFDTKAIEAWLGQYQLDDIIQYDMTVQSDIAANYLRLGEFEAAMSIFEYLQEKYPEKYEINANLGTTYELLGKNDLALKYIKKGLALNPDSHEGSEWIHVEILEAKLAIEKDSTWLHADKGNKIVDLEAEARARIHQNQNLSKETVFRQMQENLDLQLRTRIPFAPSSDVIMYLLFKELANFSATHFSTSYAHGYATMANYYAPNSLLKTETASMMQEYAALTKELYKGEQRIEKLPELNYYLEESTFEEGRNGVNWLKRAKPLPDIFEKKEEKTTNYWLIGGLLLALAVAIGLFFKNRKG